MTQQNRFCTKCGAQMPAGTKFCPSCGVAVEEVVVAQAAPQQPVANAYQAPAAQPAPGANPMPGQQYQQPYQQAPQYGVPQSSVVYGQPAQGMTYYYVTIVLLFLSAAASLYSAVTSFLGNNGLAQYNMFGILNDLKTGAMVSGIMYLIVMAACIAGGVILLMKKKQTPMVATWIWAVVALLDIIAMCCMVIPATNALSGLSMFNMQAKAYADGLTIGLVLTIIFGIAEGVVFYIVNKKYFGKRANLFTK